MEKTRVLIYMNIVLIVVNLLLLININHTNNTDSINTDKYSTDINKINLEGVDKVMIVAHPDDEMLWGGAHLIEDTYLVVCVTCGYEMDREMEFEKVMSGVNCPYLSLRYPDRNEWKYHKDSIINDLKEIINYKDFKYIVTHNPEGEYGHIQHIKVNEYVTQVADKKKLYYFGRYYSKSELKHMNKSLKPITEELLQKKRELLTIYESQKEIVDYYREMHKYENFISYNDWYN